MALYKALYGKKCRSPLHWDEVREKNELARTLGPKLTQQMIEQVKMIQEMMKQVQD